MQHADLMQPTNQRTHRPWTSRTRESAIIGVCFALSLPTSTLKKTGARVGAKSRRPEGMAAAIAQTFEQRDVHPLSGIMALFKDRRSTRSAERESERLDP